MYIFYSNVHSNRTPLKGRLQIVKLEIEAMNYSKGGKQIEQDEKLSIAAYQKMICCQLGIIYSKKNRECLILRIQSKKNGNLSLSSIFMHFPSQCTYPPRNHRLVLQVATQLLL
ncbi:hypothetical protein Hanom_Chr13g01210371 [Helianthus anomalus]